MGYSKQAIIGLSWISAFRVVSRGISLMRLVILARIISPSEFGVFGIATIALAFLEILTETGINVFLIQLKKDIDRFINSAWIVSILRGTIMSIVILAASPFIVDFFKLPDLHRFLLLISIVPFIRGFINPSIIKYQKELKFNNEFYLRLAIFIFDSTISLILVFLTHDAIGFVWGLVAGALFEVILSFALFKPYPRLKFNPNMIKTIVRSGKWVTFSGIFNYIAENGDNIVVGKILGPSALGIYEMGYNIATLPISEVADVFNKVAFPVYSRISEDIHRLRKAFIKSSLGVSFAVIILSILIFLLPKELFVLVLGEKWLGVIFILKPLVLYGALRGISGTTSALFLSMGKQNYVAVMTFIRLLVLAITIVPLTVSYGLVGASYAPLLSVIAELPIITYYIWKTFKK